MVPTTVRYASRLLSKNASNIYRPVTRPKLRSRFASTWQSYIPPPMGIVKPIFWGFGFGLGWAVTSRVLDIFYFKAKKVVDTTKAAVQDVKSHVKETKDEVKEIIQDTRENRGETAVRLVDLAKERKAKWKARKDEGQDDDRPRSEDETS